MLERCFCRKFKERKPTYIGCYVCDDWLVFSNFRSWMEQQDWQGKHLDKDILVVGNKVYSPDTCVFIDAKVNTFPEDHGSARGDYPLGVCLVKTNGNFRAKCRNPFTKKTEHLGYFNCPEKAHLAWKKRKHELACMLADDQPDLRVANALRTRYL